MVATIAAVAAARSAASAPARPSIVMITLDTTRADHLGSYGWRFARTPNLDALAARGTRFERCDTAAPLTLPSHVSLMTGLYPFRHGVRDNAGFSLGASAPTLASLLKEGGYDTGAVVSAVVLRRNTGLARGFRVYDDDLGAGFDAGTVIPERQAEATTEAALAVLKSLKVPFFLWVHYFDPHDEYRPPTRFRGSIPGPTPLYDGEIAYVDEQLGRLLSALPKATVVAAVGDHGEMLGDHGEATHGLLPFAGARRVPLLLAEMGRSTPRVLPQIVRTVDLVPTLLKVAGRSVPEGLDGRSLAPLLAGLGDEPRASYCEALMPFFSYGWYPLRTLSSGPWLFVDAPTPGLHDLRSDPAETVDQSNRHPSVLARWRARLESLLRSGGETLLGSFNGGKELTEEERAALASLGYLGGAGGRVTTSLPDPRKMAGVSEEIAAAGRLVSEGKCSEAVGRLEELARRNPGSEPLFEMLGVCRMNLREPAKAIQAFGAATRLAPRRAGPWADLAGALLALGRTNEAESTSRKALALDPSQPGAAVLLSDIASRSGRSGDALDILTRAIEAGGRSAQVFMARGLIHAAARHLDLAEPDFREAVRRRPASPEPLEHLARAVYARGRAGEAATLYEQLAALQPSRADVWKTLGAIRFYDLGDRASAARCFRSALRTERDPAERAALEALLAETER